MTRRIVLFAVLVFFHDIGRAQASSLDEMMKRLPGGTPARTPSKSQPAPTGPAGADVNRAVTGEPMPASFAQTADVGGIKLGMEPSAVREVLGALVDGANDERQQKIDAVNEAERASAEAGLPKKHSRAAKARRAEIREAPPTVEVTERFDLSLADQSFQASMGTIDDGSRRLYYVVKFTNRGRDPVLHADVVKALLEKYGKPTLRAQNETWFLWSTAPASATPTGCYSVPAFVNNRHQLDEAKTAEKACGSAVVLAVVSKRDEFCHNFQVTMYSPTLHRKAIEHYLASKAGVEGAKHQDQLEQASKAKVKL